MISVIVPTYNRRHLLANCLDSIFQCEKPENGFEVLVVDDGSEDDTWEYLQKQANNKSNLRVFRQENKGPASARNLGAENSKGNILAFTDDDCTVSPSWLITIDKVMKKNGFVGLEGPVYGRAATNALYSPLSHIIDHQGPKGYITCNLAIAKETFNRVGCFDKRFRSAHEDIDLCLRILKNGKIGYDESMKVNHPARKYNWKKEMLHAFQYSRDYVDDEYLLYSKHPEEYNTVRYRKTFYVTMIHASLKRCFHQSKAPLHSILHYPLDYAGLVTINMAQQIAIIFWFAVKLIVRENR